MRNSGGLIQCDLEVVLEMKGIITISEYYICQTKVIDTNGIRFKKRMKGHFSYLDLKNIQYNAFFVVVRLLGPNTLNITIYPQNDIQLFQPRMGPNDQQGMANHMVLLSANIFVRNIVVQHSRLSNLRSCTPDLRICYQETACLRMNTANQN